MNQQAAQVEKFGLKELIAMGVSGMTGDGFSPFSGFPRPIAITTAIYIIASFKGATL